MGLSAPFLNVYLTDIGFTATEIGILISIGAVLELTLNPVMNQAADYFGSHRRLYGLFVWCSSIANVLFATVSNRLLLQSAYLLNQSVTRGSMTLLSQLTITRLDQMKRDLFSRTRMWGSVGWAVATITSGTLLAVGGYPMAFMASALMSMAMIPLLSALPVRTNETEPGETSQPEPRRASFFILAASQFVFFLGLNGVMAFIWVFVEQDLGVPVEHIGYYAAFFAISELMPMMFMDKVIRRFGVRKVLIVGMLGMAFVWVAYSFITTPGWLLVAQLARGLFFTMFMIGVAVLVARTSAPANVATNQAIIQVTMPGLATLIASPFSGWVFDNLGSAWMFRISAVIAVIATTILIVNYHRLDNRKQANS